MPPAPSARSEDRVVLRHRGLAGRMLLVSGLTAVSRVLGFVREALSALLFGHASTVYDAFVTAWRVPNLFRRLLGEGALATSLQTTMTEEDADRGDEAGRRLFLETVGRAFWILVGVTAVLMGIVALAPDRMPGTGWAWLGRDPAPVRELIVRLAPFVILICLAALASGALQVRGRFGAPAWAPVVLNLVWIGTLLGVGAAFGWARPPWNEAAMRARDLEMARALSWGVLLAGLAQLLVQLPALARAGLLPRRGQGSPAPAAARGAGDVLRASLPLALGAAVYQINVMLDGLMAEALLPRGGPTTYYYANRIQQLPLALIAVAATSAVFPALKALGHRGQLAELRALHDRTHLAVTFVALPAVAGLLVLAEPIVAVLLQHGAFGAEGVARTASALRILAVSLVPAGAIGLVTRTWFALGDFRTPVRVSSWMLAANVALNYAFVRGLGLDVDGLAWATAITAWLQLAFLMPPLARRLPSAPQPARAARRLPRQVAAAAACGLAAWGAHRAMTDDPRSVAALIGAILAGALAFGASARALRLPEWRRLAARLPGRSA